ncbi:MAG: heparinase II/III-family protein [Niveispirillum sp.]|nr:heparinase II/III-family protein [Niveispirillum sp.]
MRIAHFFLAPALLLGVATVPAWGQQAAGPTMAFKGQNIDRLRDMISRDPLAKTRAEDQRKIADAALKNPPKAERKIDDALKALALTYRLTGQQQYADGARDLLLKRAAKADWLTDMPLARRDPPWRSDLGMGFAAAAYGLAYDAIRETLSPQDRKAIVDGLVRGAIQPILNDWVDGAHRIHALDTMGHNWWAHIVFGAGVGVLSILRDEPQAAEWAHRIDAASVEWFRYSGSRIESKPPTFGDDGAYSETVNYAELGLHSLLLFRRSWVEVMGAQPSVIPALDKVAANFFANAYPRKDGWVSLNFGDSRPPSCGCASLAILWALGERDPAFLTYIDGFAGVPEKDPWGDADNLPYLPSATDRDKAGLPNLPTAAIFPSQGLVTMRDGWQPDATLFALKSGYTWNHNHADAGSFILHHQGRTLLSDSGHSVYSSPEYDGYYRQSLAHNVVTIDGKAIPPSDTYDGTHNMGTVDHLIDVPGFRYVWADATGPTARYFQRNFRNVLWVGGTILVLDDVRAWEMGQYEWLLHYQGTAKRSGKVVQIADGDAAVDVQPLFPAPLPDGGLKTDYPEAMRLMEHVGLKDAEPKVTIPYLGFQPAEKREREKFLVAIQPVVAGQPAERLERLEGQNWIGVRLTGKGRVTEIYLNLLADGRIRHRNANNTIAGYETDAYIITLSWPEGSSPNSQPEQLFIANGSYVRRDGQVILDSLSKLFAHLNFGSTPSLTLSTTQPDVTLHIGCQAPVAVLGTETGLACNQGRATLVHRAGDLLPGNVSDVK